MKRIILLLSIAYCFAGDLTAQPLQVVSAVENGVVHGPGMALPRNVDPHYIYDVHYTITLSCNNFKSIVLDSLYLGSICTRLTINSNVSVDSQQHTYTISVAYNGPGNKGITPGSGREKERRTIASDLVIYKYRGKKFILPIKGITVGHMVYPC
jgi:hypothetical protein